MFFANRVAIQARDTYKRFTDTAGHGPQITPYFSLKNTKLENFLSLFRILKRLYKVKKFERCPFRRPCTYST